MRLSEHGQESRAFEPRLLIDNGVDVVRRNDVVAVEENHPTARSSHLNSSILIEIAIKIPLVPPNKNFPLEVGRQGISKTIDQFFIRTIGAAIIRDDNTINPLVVFDLRDCFTKHLKSIVMGKAKRYHF